MKTVSCKVLFFDVLLLYNIDVYGFECFIEFVDFYIEQWVIFSLDDFDMVIRQLGRFFRMSLVRDTIFARASFTELLEISFVPTSMILPGFLFSSGWM